MDFDDSVREEEIRIALRDEIRVRVEDQGIGRYEYGSERGVDRHMVDVCDPDEGEAVLHTGTTTVIGVKTVMDRDEDGPCGLDVEVDVQVKWEMVVRWSVVG